jgi:hypothetical protein
MKYLIPYDAGEGLSVSVSAKDAGKEGLAWTEIGGEFIAGGLGGGERGAG